MITALLAAVGGMIWEKQEIKLPFPLSYFSRTPKAT